MTLLRNTNALPMRLCRDSPDAVMQVDVILDAREPSGRLAELGLLAERTGIRGVWVSSLLDSRDPFANLARLAEDTSTLLLGPIAVNPFDTHPARIAAGHRPGAVPDATVRGQEVVQP